MAFAVSLGDLGPILPLAIVMIMINGFNQNFLPLSSWLSLA